MPRDLTRSIRLLLVALAVSVLALATWWAPHRRRGEPGSLVVLSVDDTGTGLGGAVQGGPFSVVVEAQTTTAAADGHPGHHRDTGGDLRFRALGGTVTGNIRGTGRGSRSPARRTPRSRTVSSSRRDRAAGWRQAGRTTGTWRGPR